MALIANLLASVPATWMDNTDNVKIQPGDAADATRPDIWRYEGGWFRSGIGPNGENGIDIMTSYVPDWRFVQTIFNNIGTVLLSGSVPGNGWDMTRGRFVLRFYMDSDVRADITTNGLTVIIYSSNSRDGIFNGNEAIVMWLTESGGNMFVEVDPGNTALISSGPIAWSSVENKHVEFEWCWQCETPGSADGYIQIRVRNSNDGASWSAIPEGVLQIDATSVALGANTSTHRVGSVTYGMSVAIGRGTNGAPGLCYKADLYDDDAGCGGVSIPTDYTDPCCDTTPRTSGVSSAPVSMDDHDIEILPGFDLTCDATGSISSSATPSGGESWQ